MAIDDYVIHNFLEEEIMEINRLSRDEPKSFDQAGRLLRRMLLQNTFPKRDELAERTIQFADRYLKDIKDGDSFLDVGCFVGFMFHYLKNIRKVNVKYSGFDIYELGVKVCQYMIPEGEFFIRDMFVMDGRKFDYVWLCQAERYELDKLTRLLGKLKEAAVKKFYMICPRLEFSKYTFLKDTYKITRDEQKFQSRKDTKIIYFDVIENKEES